jgi:hypothetical protein
VFTEKNPQRELTTAAHLAAASRALKDLNDTLSFQALEAAGEIYKTTDGTGHAKVAKIHAAVELLLSTGDREYRDYLLSETEFIIGAIEFRSRIASGLQYDVLCIGSWRKISDRWLWT